MLAIIDAARVASAEGRRVAVGLALREAAPGDSDRVLRWRNDPASISASITGAADPAGHAGWFARVLADPARTLWIAEEHGVPVGSVRIDRGDDAGTAQISIAVAPEARGRRLATPILNLASAAAAAIGVSRLVATIRRENEPSMRAFRAAGYGDAAADRVSLTLERRAALR